MAPEAQPEAAYFDPNGPGMGLDVDFNNFDLGDIDAIDIDRVVANFGFNTIDFNKFDLGGLDIINNGINYTSVKFDFEDTLKEAESRETLQANEKSEELSLAEASNPGNSTHQELVHSNEIRAQKRKKTEEVDKDRILPEGSRRNRNKTARARGLDSLA
jgi:hypothetical protein